MRAQALAIGFALLAGQWQSPATSQQQPAQVSPVPVTPEAQDPAEHKAYTWQDLLNKNPGAIENEKKYYDTVSDPGLKQRVASILLGLGVRDRTYLDYLVAAAKKALENDEPWPFLYAADGNKNTDPNNPIFAGWMREKGLDPNDPKFAALVPFSPTFLDWCKKNHREPNDATNEAELVTPIPWFYLAAAGDPRAYDLLIQGLYSHNLLIAAEAANGLAKLQDSRAISSLIDAGHKQPGEARQEIAVALLFFADPKAQAAAEELALDKKLLAIERSDMKKQGIKLLFDW